MKRAMIAAGACAAVLGLAPGAQAATNQTEYECVGTATWHVTVAIAGQSYATRTLDAPAGACKKIHAGVTDDHNFSINSFDTGDSAGPGTVYLTGVGASGVEAYAGAMTGNDGLLKGPVVIDGSMLYATLTGANASPWTVTEVHTGLGSCGLNCYATQAVWTGSYPG